MPDFNVWDALDLKPDVNLASKTLQKSFNRASLHCHPDKLALRHPGTAHAFPQYSHLDEAKAFLTHEDGSIDVAAVSDACKYFARTRTRPFDSSKPVGDEGVFDLRAPPNSAVRRPESTSAPPPEVQDDEWTSSSADELTHSQVEDFASLADSENESEEDTAGIDDPEELSLLPEYKDLFSWPAGFSSEEEYDATNGKPTPDNASTSSEDDIAGAEPKHHKLAPSNSKKTSMCTQTSHPRGASSEDEIAVAEQDDFASSRDNEPVATRSKRKDTPKMNHKSHNGKAPDRRSRSDSTLR